MSSISFYNKPVPEHRDMCDNVSEMILRTNPKLSTNVKIMVGDDFVSLDSFNACREISSSKYKNFNTYTTSTYNADVAKFWKNTETGFAYKVMQEHDNTSMKDDYGQQYETFYWAGCEYIDSLEYNEEYGMLAPLWLDKNIPERFVIFKINDPSYWNFVMNATDPRELDFKEDILKKCKILKTIDLTENSRIGSYIRRYASQKGFPEAPFTMTDEWISFNGINYETGTFTSKKENYSERFWQHDDTVLEFDKYITEGFERNNIIVANLLNIEFLFDDPEADEYKFTRYFGLYCNFIEDGKFEISKHGLYNTGNTYSDSVHTFDIYNNKPFIAENELGVVVPFKTSSVSDTDLLPDMSIMSANNSVFCIQDINNDLHSINKLNDIPTMSSGYSALRLDESSIDLDVFKGFVEKVESVSCVYENTKTPSSMTCTLTDTVPAYSTMQLFQIVGSTEVVLAELKSVPSGAIVIPGTWDWDMFCGDGSLEEIAKAICGSFNQITDVGIHAYYDHETIHFISFNSTPAYNQFGIRLVNCPVPSCITFANDGMLFGSNDWEHVKCKKELAGTFKPGDYLPSTTHNGFCRIDAVVTDYDNAVKKENDEISFPDGVWCDVLLDSNGVIVSRTNHTKIYESFKPSYGRLSFFPVKDFEFSSWHNVTKYGDTSELDYETEKIQLSEELIQHIVELIQNQLTEMSVTVDASDILDVFLNTTDDIVISSDTATYSIQVLSGPNENDEYVISIDFLAVNGAMAGQTEDSIAHNFSFDTLSTTLNVPMLTYLKNEYMRCYENMNPSLMTLSKTQPWICAWVMKNGKDVREKPYRLNSNPVFGQYSFSPSANNYEPNTEAYNQEWFYIMAEPPVMSGSTMVDQRKLWSYTGFKISDVDDFEDKLRDVNENWFDVFFKRDHVKTGKNSVPNEYYSTPDYANKYSLLRKGNDFVNAETFFRGAKLEFMMKSDWSEKLDNNLDVIKVKRGYDLNDYKFTAVCVPLYVNDGSSVSNLKMKVIRNDKFKTITLINYIIQEYTDAVDLTILELPSPYKMVLDKIERYTMYNPSGDAAKKNDNVAKPVSTKGGGKITDVSSIGGGKYTITGNGTSFLSDFDTYNPKDVYYNNPQNPYYKEILLVNDVSLDVQNRIYAVLRILEVVSDTKMIGEIRGNADSSSVCDIFNRWDGIISLANVVGSTASTVFWNDYYILNCNYSQLASNMNKCVFASVKHTINSTQHDGMTYELVDEDGTLHSSESANAEFPYAIRVVDPLENAKYEYMSLLFDGEWVTYGILPSHAAPMYRHTGIFTPLRNDVLYYTDPFIKDFATNPDLVDPVKEKFFKNSRHMNTCFDSDLSDFGIIKDLCFHRTNESNPNVFKLTGGDKPVYPVSNRFAIGHRDVQVFNSSWDPWYFTRTIANTLEEDCHGTLSMKENKSFFGSKCMNMPEKFSFETFTFGETDGNDVVVSVNGSHIEMKVNIEKKLTDTIGASLIDMFQHYVDEQYSYGDKTTVEDDVESYIKQNLIKLYQFDSITLWVKEESASTGPYFLWDGLPMNDLEKRQHGLKETHVMGVSSIDVNKLDKKIVFNIKNGTRYTFGLHVDVTKK